jgi:colanic acid/amylovoran biosynthesis glycosyltransferase
VKKYLNRTETFIYEPLRNIRDFNVIILTETVRNRSDFPHEKIYSISDLPGKNPWLELQLKQLGRPPLFEKAIKNHDVKLIHAHFAFEGIQMLHLKKKFNLPLVTSFYGIDLYQFISNPIYRRQLKRLFKTGDLFLSFSEQMRQQAIRLGCPENKVLTHHGGADFSKFTFSPRGLNDGGNIDILMVGRFVEKKGFKIGIKAFSIIEKTYPNARLNIIGDGPMKDEIENLISSLNLKGKVNLLGAKSHSEYIRNLESSHILLAPSIAARSGDEEGGINTVVIEAFATGLPVIATMHAGSELVFDGKTGYVVKDGDEKDLADKIRIFLSNPESWPSLGENARKLVEEEFDMIEQTRKLEGIYKELIDKYDKR